MVGATGSAGGATGAKRRPVCARWRSTAAIAAAVTASTIWFKEGRGSASEAFIMLELGREGAGVALRGAYIFVAETMVCCYQGPQHGI